MQPETPPLAQEKIKCPLFLRHKSYDIFFSFHYPVMENTGEMQIISLSSPLKLKQRIANIMITETKFQQIDQYKEHWL